MVTPGPPVNQNINNAINFSLVVFNDTVTNFTLHQFRLSL